MVAPVARISVVGQQLIETSTLPVATLVSLGSNLDHIELLTPRVSWIKTPEERNRTPKLELDSNQTGPGKHASFGLRVVATTLEKQ